MKPEQPRSTGILGGRLKSSAKEYHVKRSFGFVPLVRLLQIYAKPTHTNKLLEYHAGLNTPKEHGKNSTIFLLFFCLELRSTIPSILRAKRSDSKKLIDVQDDCRSACAARLTLSV